MNDYGMMGTSWFGMGIGMLFWVALYAFIFALIFWLTYKWVVKK